MLVQGEIYVDDRAGSKELVLHPPLNTLGELCRLDSADVMFTGNGPDGPVLIGIEVKSLSDLLSSTDTGRLQATQIPAMLSTYDVSYLLWYGIARPSPLDASIEILKTRQRVESRNQGVQWRWVCATSRDIGVAPSLMWSSPFSKRQGKPLPYSYISALEMSITLRGVHVQSVHDVYEAVNWIVSAYHYWQKPWAKHKLFRTLDTTLQPDLPPGLSEKKKQIVKTAASLPNIRLERALKAAKHFESVRDMINADEAEWAEIKGFGKVIARTVVEAVS